MTIIPAKMVRHLIKKPLSLASYYIFYCSKSLREKTAFFFAKFLIPFFNF